MSERARESDSHHSRDDGSIQGIQDVTALTSKETYLMMFYNYIISCVDNKSEIVFQKIKPLKILN